ncbi:MAG: ribonuclease H-like domain-containing protein, partial [Rectinemataceae bacterium]
MAASLSSRLKRLRETRATSSPLPDPAIESAEPDLPEFLALWERIAPHAYRRSVTSPMDNFPSVLDADPFVARLARYSLPSILERLERLENRLPWDVRELRFFDLETTGLSGGAGTIAFLATVARPSDGSLFLEQFFLSDYPGEASYLRAVLSALGPAPLLVTHNGKAFDVPLLRTRCLMQGLSFPEPRLHLDFLMTARRLWRSMLGGASLGLLERGVLGLERSGDVPGQDIPGIWLASLRSGFHPLLPQVFTHNLLDVENLAALLA